MGRCALKGMQKRQVLRTTSVGKKTSAKDIISSTLSSEHSWNWDPLFFVEAKYYLSANWQRLFSLKDIIT